MSSLYQRIGEAHADKLIVKGYIWCLDAMICVYFACASMILTYLEWWLEWQSHCWAVHCVAFGIWRKHFGKPGYLGSMFFTPFVHTWKRHILGMPFLGGRGKSCQERTATEMRETRETHRDVLEQKEGAEASVVARRHWRHIWISMDWFRDFIRNAPWSFYPQITDGVSCISLFCLNDGIAQRHWE